MLDFGGSERVILNLLEHIDPERFEPHLALLEGSGAWLRSVPPNVPVHALGAQRCRRAVIPFARLCRTIRPHAVLSTSAHLNATVIAARPLLPRRTALITREGADLTSPQVVPSLTRMFLYKQAYRCSDLVICQSDYMMDSLVRKFGLLSAKVLRIYNPVDIETITRLAQSEANPLPQMRTNLVAVGRFSHEKGFDLLLESMRIVQQAIPLVSLTLVGDGPDLSFLQATRRRLGLESCVHFSGLQHNPYPFLKHAHLVAVPSRTEAFPNVALEAIALGTPVMAANCTPALAEISCCTKLLHVVPSTTPVAFAAGIISLLQNSTSRIKSDPDLHFQARFGISGVVQQYEHALLDTIRARRRKAASIVGGREVLTSAR